MRSTLIAGFAIFATLGMAQAPDFGGKEQAEKMKALSFLTGRWEGDATFSGGGRTIPVKGYENVEFMAGGTCAIVNASWSMKAGDRDVPIHQPCAMIWWDTEKKAYRMISQLSNGLRSEFEVQVKENSFTWNLNHPQLGEVRYTMNLLADGTWHEIGERKLADGKMETVVEMKLKKVK